MRAGSSWLRPGLGLLSYSQCVYGAPGRVPEAWPRAVPGGHRMSQATAPIRHTDRFYIGGQWVEPSSDAKISVIDSDTEQVYFTVPEAQAADISRAVGAAREAFDR